MTRPGFRYTCTITRPTVAGRDDELGAPTYTSTTIVASEPCAAGQFAAATVPQGVHGGVSENVELGVHVALGIDVRQGDIVTLVDSPWDGEYVVADVRTLAIQQRLLCEANNAG
jgi:hypothetical protein